MDDAVVILKFQPGVVHLVSFMLSTTAARLNVIISNVPAGFPSRVTPVLRKHSRSCVKSNAVGAGGDTVGLNCGFVSWR